MKNRWIYYATLIISLLFVILPLFCEKEKSSILSVFSGIGCSAMAAAVMALFLERADTVRAKKKKQLARHIFFRQFNDQISMLIERVIWFDERINDQSFNWNRRVEEYSSFGYMVKADHQYKERDISFEEAVEMLKQLSKKYGKEEMLSCSDQEKMIIQRMFSIIAVSSQAFFTVAKGIKKDRLILAVEDYLSIEDNDRIQFDVQMIIGTMVKKLDAYNNTIDSIIRLAETVRKLGNFDTGIRVGLHGSFSILDL